MNEEVLRVPPHSVDSEQAVLGGLMIDPQALPKIADWLVEEDFYRKDHRLIFRAISELTRRSQPCDSVTMGEWFEENKLADLVGGVGYVIQIANSTPSAANIVAYAEIVREKSILRQLIDVGTTITSNAFTPAGRASSDIVAVASQALTGFAATRRAGLVPAKASLKALAAAQAERYAQGPGLLGLPTPWTDLNRITRGLRNGSLYILGARPSMGKSVFCGNLAYFTALRGKRVAIFSAEMTAQEYAARAVAAHGRIPFEWVEHPVDADADEFSDGSEVYWQRNSTIISRLLESPVLIDDTPAVKIEQLQARARREHMRKPLELIVIDHLHDMGIDPKAEARHEYGRAVQGCKTLAKEFNCPVVLAAQLNRSSATRADKRPTMADLRESGEIEQKADVILFLHREDYYDPNNAPGNVELIPAKGRNIKTGDTIHLKNRFDEMRLDDGEPPKVSKARARSRFDATEPACAL